MQLHSLASLLWQQSPGAGVLLSDKSDSSSSKSREFLPGAEFFLAICQGDVRRQDVRQKSEVVQVTYIPQPVANTLRT